MTDWNPDYLRDVQQKVERLNRMRKDPDLYIRVCAYYRENIADFINDWMFTYDPRRRTMKTLPFKLYPEQREVVQWFDDCYNDRQDGVLVKCREVGMSWLSGAYAASKLVFEREFKCAFGSRKEILVDRIGDLDSIFEKISFMLHRLPPEFKPNYTRHHLKIINKNNDASITGEAGDNIGRGGRNSIYFKDESAFYERPLQIEAALSENSDCKIDISTPNGVGNPFYERAHSPYYRQYRFDWRKDPRKNQQWYDDRKAKLPPSVFAQEIDMDFHASVEGIVIPSKYVQACVNADIGEISGKKKAVWDVADEFGADENAAAYGQGVFITEIDHWNGVTTTESARRVWGRARLHGAEWIAYDAMGVGAGARGELNDLKKRERMRAEQDRDYTPYKPQIEGIMGGSTDLPGTLIDGKLDKDLFANLNALMWWSMRLRAQRTYEHVNGIKRYRTEELCSLPDDPVAITQLSQATYNHDDEGKLKVSKKGEGTKSPDRADAIVYYYKKPMTAWII